MFELLLNLYNFIFPEHNGIIYAIDPLTIGLIMGGVKAAAGGIQALTAGNRQEEPKYEIPQEVFQATQRAQEMAQTGMPEASRMQALQGAQQSAVFGMRGAQDRRGGLASIGNIQAGMDRASLSVAAQDASMRLQNQRFAQQALMTQAQYRDKAFANQWQSWMNREQQRRANVGAGLQNIMGGLDMAGSMLAMGALSGGGNNTNTFGRTDLTPATSGLSPQRNTLSGMSAIMGNSTMPAMPGSQLRSPSNIPQPNYGLTSDQMLSRSIFQSLITR
jgi:hypothetical protein